MSLQAEKNIPLEEVHVGVKDVAITQLLSKNMTSLFVEDVLER